MSFLLKNLPLQNIMFITLNFIAIFLFQYSLIGIVKPKFIRKNNLMQNLGNRRSVQKCAHKAGSYVLKTPCLHNFIIYQKYNLKNIHNP